jgi:hypothetical protein
MPSPDLYVKCGRCWTLEYVGNATPLKPPQGWGWRTVAAEWAFGATPSEVLACRSCLSAIDAEMKRAWTRAVEHPAEQAPAPRKEPPAP